MANEITKITDQNGVDHPLVDVLGREATVDMLKDTVGWTGKNKADSSKGTTSGTNIFTYNSSDKTVTANGTGGPNNSQYSIPLNVSGDFYFLGCPDGGAVDKYDIYLYDNTAGARVKQWDGVTQSLSNYGNTPCQAQIPEGHNVVMSLRVFAGHEVNNIAFKPMLITKEDYELSPAYEPHHESVEEYAFSRSEQAVLGAVNLVRSIAASKEQNGLHFVVNDDKEVAIWGTATAETELQIMKNLENSLNLGDTYYLSGCTDGSSSTYCLQYLDYNGTTPAISNYSGVTPITIFTPTGLFSSLRILVRNGVNMGTEQNPTIIKPMIALSPNTPYAPPAMTNKELTEKVTPSAGAITAETGFTVHQNTRLEKSGNMVTLGLYMIGVSTTAETWTHIANIPEGFKPRSADSLMCGFFWAGGTNFGQMQVTSAGRIQIYSYSSALSNVAVLANLSWVTE